MAEAKRDQNFVPTLLGVSSVDGVTPVVLYADPVTHRLLVDLPSGGGSVTSVSVVSANGFAGSVADPTTTPAITLSTTVTGILKGNGTAISAAVSGTDLKTVNGTSIIGSGDITTPQGTVTAVSIATANGFSGSSSGGATPALTIVAGAITPTTVNGLTISSTTGTLTITNSKTLSVTNTITLSGTDSTVMTFPSTSATIARTDAGQTFTGVQVFTTPTITTANLSGSQQLAEGASIKLDTAGSADGAFSGITITGTAGATVAFGDLVYLAAADSRWELTDADAASTSGDVPLAMVLSAGNDGDPVTLLLYGNIRADAAFPALTIGAPAYVSTTAGDIQVAQPSGTDDVIRRVGFALTADELLFNPSNDYITHT